MNQSIKCSHTYYYVPLSSHWHNYISHDFNITLSSKYLTLLNFKRSDITMTFICLTLPCHSWAWHFSPVMLPFYTFCKYIMFQKCIKVFTKCVKRFTKCTSKVFEMCYSKKIFGNNALKGAKKNSLEIYSCSLHQKRACL